VKEHLSIGEVAAQTGLSVDTIRMWERRYGRPRPVRLGSGHRRYTSEQVHWLRRVAEALSFGYRAGQVVRASTEELDLLLSRGLREGACDPEVSELLAHVHAMRPKELRADLLTAWRSLGPGEFLTRRLSPFVVQVGRAWADGALEVRHEHLVSEVVHDVLRELTASQGAAPEGRPVLLATMTGERHTLGMRMVALACAVHGVPRMVLGADLPPEQIARAAVELDARAVLVSVSLATAGPETERRLRALRRALPEELPLVVGGRGLRPSKRPPRGIEYLREFEDLDAWLASLSNDVEEPEPALP
jgi:DNA-binding transcriptional MerR regulator/methylmalonyl-CoA mutase cobalamin-binding subunit